MKDYIFSVSMSIENRLPTRLCYSNCQQFIISSFAENPKEPVSMTALPQQKVKHQRESPIDLLIPLCSRE
jgi:hypothetical protein